MRPKLIWFLFTITCIFAQDIFKTKATGISVDDADSWYLGGFTTRAEGEYVYLSADPIGDPPPIDIFRSKLKDVAVQDYDFAGDTLIGFSTSGPDAEGWVYLTAELKNGGTGEILRTKLKDFAVDNYSAPAGYWINRFSASGPDAEGWVYLTASATLIGVEEETEKNECSINKQISNLGDVLPNPAVGSVRINYSVATAGKVNLVIYDVGGRLVKTLVRKYQSPKNYTLTWSCDDGQGRKLSAGVYLLHFMVDEFQATGKILVLK